MPLVPFDLMGGYQFWREGWRRCMATFARSDGGSNSGEKVTLENIVKIMESLPNNREDFLPDSEWVKQSYLSACLKSMFERDTSAEKEEAKGYIDNFLIYLTKRSWLARETLVDSFVGILRGVEYGMKPDE